MADNIFSNLVQWQEGGTREIEPLGLKGWYDIHNNYNLRKIYSSDSEQRELVFEFEGHPTLDGTVDNNVVNTFELIFTVSGGVHSSPENFVPFSGTYKTDDFVYQLDPNSGEPTITWFGDSDSSEPDPMVRFTTTKVTFRA